MSPWSLASRQYLHAQAQKLTLGSGAPEEPPKKNQEAALTKSGSGPLSPGSQAGAQGGASPPGVRASTPATALSGLQNKKSIYHFPDNSREIDYNSKEAQGPESAAGSPRPRVRDDLGTEPQAREDGREPVFRKDLSVATQEFPQFQGPGQASI